MGLITVRAMKSPGVWVEGLAKPNPQGHPYTVSDGKLYMAAPHGPDGKGEIFQIDESKFSDWHDVRYGKNKDGSQSSVALRGSMERVKSELVNGVMTWVRDESPLVKAEAAPAPAPAPI